MQPIAFNLGSLPVYWYGILLAAAFGLGLWTAGRRGLRDGLKPDVFYDLGFCLILGVLIGARIFYVVSYWEKDFAGQPLWHIFKIRNGGLVFYGGFIGAALALNT